MELLVRWLINALVIMAAAYVLPGILVTGFGSALIAAVVMAFVNTFVKPVLVILTFPITLLTLGIFLLVLNALLILLVSALVPGFDVDGFWPALLLSIILWLVNSILHQFQSRKDEE